MIFEYTPTLPDFFKMGEVAIVHVRPPDKTKSDLQEVWLKYRKQKMFLLPQCVEKFPQWIRAVKLPCVLDNWP